MLQTLFRLACVVAGCWLPVSAVQAGDCRSAAIEQLRNLSPDGFAIYEQTRDKAFFRGWISCDDLQLGLATAVHESVHFITAHTDAFPLVNGGQVKRPPALATFFAPSRIAGGFATSEFVTTYLRPGRASSSEDFTYLLDELNAYSHDLNAAMDLNVLHPAHVEVAHRDGLAATMAFVARYVETAERSRPETWNGLQQPEVAGAVAAIWDRAETVMASSCGIPHFGHEDKTFIRQFCEAGAQSAMAKVLGRAPVCPTACLASPAPSDEEAD